MVPELLPDDVRQFVASRIDSVPHLEALLLIWESAPRAWTPVEVAHRVYLPEERAEGVLRELIARGWIAGGAAGYAFDAGSPDAAMIGDLAQLYRSNLIRIAEIIHRKAPPAVLDFARAFELRKDR
jgi:hypothetical protein